MATLAQTNDEELMLLVQQQDRRACDVLVLRHKEHAFMFALQLLGNREDAMDAAQEAFVKVFTKAHLYQSGRPFWPWFLAILRNCIRSLQRTFWFKRKAHSNEVLAYLVDPSADTAMPSRAAELWEAVLALPAKLREVMILRHVEDLDYRQIASVLDIPSNTVATRLYAARKKLAVKYEL